MEEPIRSQGSFIDSSRLYALQGGIAQQQWRIGELCHRLVEFLRPFLTHPYKNVRDRLGSVLANIYMSDLEFSNEIFTGSGGEMMDTDEQSQNNGPSNKRNPRVVDFINEVVPQLEMMSQEPDEVGAVTEKQNSMRNGGTSHPLMNMNPSQIMSILQNPTIQSSGDLANLIGKTKGDVLSLLAKNSVGMVAPGNSSSGMPSHFPKHPATSKNPIEYVNTADAKLPYGAGFLPEALTQAAVGLPTPPTEQMNLYPNGLMSKNPEFEKRQVAIRLLQTGKHNGWVWVLPYLTEGWA